MTHLLAPFSKHRAARVVCAAALLAPLGAFAAELQLNIADGPATSSTLYVALFDSADAYTAGTSEKALASQTAPMRAGAAEVVFRGLAPGRYAVRMFADENGNAKLDTNLMGMPTERYGFSNDAKGKRAAPGFDAAAISVDADVKTTVHLR
jgi:uncharacterized protein (DUF2141 family)